MKQPVRKDIRLKGWDYSNRSCYHVTVCTHEGRLLLSTISDDTYSIELTDIGECVQQAIEQAQLRYPSVLVENYVIMPNHIHLLLAIDECDVTLGRFMGFMKSYATRSVRKTHPGIVLWQRNYYDRIIRKDEDFFEVWKYIDENPIKWASDDYYA